MRLERPLQRLIVVHHMHRQRHLRQRHLVKWRQWFGLGQRLRLPQRLPPVEANGTEAIGSGKLFESGNGNAEAVETLQSPAPVRRGYGWGMVRAAFLPRTTVTLNIICLPWLPLIYLIVILSAHYPCGLYAEASGTGEVDGNRLPVPSTTWAGSCPLSLRNSPILGLLEYPSKVIEGHVEPPSNER